jgi:hypothetical protein
MERDGAPDQETELRGEAVTRKPTKRFDDRPICDRPVRDRGLLLSYHPCGRAATKYRIGHQGERVYRCTVHSKYASEWYELKDAK